jgi:hypothetical protein
MPSRQYTDMQSRIEDLKSRFVDFEIPFERDATVHELDCIAAFRLLVHAEVETFIEDRIKHAISEVSRTWKQHRAFGQCLLHMMIKWLPVMAKEGKPTNIPMDRAELDLRVEYCVGKAKDEVNENNSIKRDALLRMSFSAGLLPEDLSEPLLTALDGYGRERGDVAHQSVGRVRTLYAPRVEGGKATDLVILLEASIN